MAFDRFLIAPFKTGLQTDLRKWMIMDDAFTQLQNAYVFRGRVVKRFGSTLMGTTPLLSRLRINIGTTDGSGNFSGTVPGTIFQPGQIFSVGSEIFTVYQTGTPAVMLDTGSATTKTYNTSTGAVVIHGAAITTAVYFYPALPTMGICQYDSGTINNHPTLAFDTTFAYIFTTGSGWARSGTAIWNGNNTNYFWESNWKGMPGQTVLYVTNFNAITGPNAPAATDDPIWYATGPSNALVWTPAFGQTGFYFLPSPAGTPLAPYAGYYVQTARLIVAYKGRLILLNTIENDNSAGPTNLGNTSGGGNASGTVAPGYGLLGQYFIIGTTTFTVVIPNGALQVSVGGTGTGTFDIYTGAYTFTGASATTAINYYSMSGNATQYPQRARYSIFGNPLAINAWYTEGQEDSSGNIYAGANYSDASTDEQIVSAEFIKDRLIVYFERSTWELAFTGNQVKPFQWNRLNNELGSQSTFSTVPFDKQILTVGNTGIHACNGSNVQRADEIIPDEVFEYFSAEPTSVIRTQGIRDYYKEMVYWTFLTEQGEASGTKTFPDQVMVYNYKNGAWAFNDDCLITFGYFEQQTDITWASSVPTTWDEFNGDWTTGVSANQRQIVAGTPQGFMLLINPEESRNAASAQITTMSINGNGTITLEIFDNNLSSNTIEFPADGDFILIENVVASPSSVETYLNGSVFRVISVSPNGNVINITTNNRYINGALEPNLTSGTYLGGGTMARVSNMQIDTKQFNPYDKEDRNVYLQRVEFAVQRTGQYAAPPVIGGGQMTIDYYPSSSPVSMIAGGVASTAIMGNSILETSPYDPSLYPLEQYQELLWHPVYFQSSGTNIQLSMSMSATQMINPVISLSEFELEAMTLYCEKTTGRME